MFRRNFLKSSALGSGLAFFPFEKIIYDYPKNKFNLNYAPHFGMFKHSAGEDLIDQLNFMADEGFTAFEDNNLKKRSISCLLYTSPSPRDRTRSRMPSSA